MLDNFRSQSITWDRANNKFHEVIELSSSDERGRRLVVQVLDNGQQVDLTGNGLNLYWETPDKHYMGLDNFEALDIRKGKFGLYVTTEMLSHIGKLNGLLYLVDMEGRATTSLKLDINVNRGINVGAVESQNSFSALTDALGRLVNIESQEILRQQQEQNRVDAENARVQAELLREQAEQQRASAFNSSQTERTNQYNQAESAREGLYETAESNRDELYEQAEQARDSEYAPRLSDVEGLVGLGGIAGSGSNEYGSFVKLEDGTAIQWGKLTIYGNENGYFGIAEAELPIALVGDFHANAILSAPFDSGRSVAISRVVAESDKKISVQITRLQSSSPIGSSYSGEFSWFAIGRWK